MTFICVQQLRAPFLLQCSVTRYVLLTNCLRHEASWDEIVSRQRHSVIGRSERCRFGGENGVFIHLVGKCRRRGQDACQQNYTAEAWQHEAVSLTHTRTHARTHTRMQPSARARAQPELCVRVRQWVCVLNSNAASHTSTANAETERRMAMVMCEGNGSLHFVSAERNVFRRCLNPGSA